MIHTDDELFGCFLACNSPDGGTYGERVERLRKWCHVVDAYQRLTGRHIFDREYP